MIRPIASGELSPTTVGAYVRGRRFVYAITATRLHATLAWGVIDEAEARSMTAAWAATVSAPPHPSMFDASAMSAADGAAFEVVRQYLVLGAGRSGILRQAIVCSPSFGGAVVTGYFTRFPPPFEFQIFERRAEALCWLGCPAEEAVLERLAADVGSGADTVIANLRAWLDAGALDRVDLDAATRQLGVTKRTLQRHLAAAGSCFTDEVASVQVARAQRLMLDPQVKLAAVAAEVGCASASTFSELFRRVTGETPSEWRRRQLATGAAEPPIKTSRR